MKFALRLCGLFLVVACLPAAYGQFSRLQVSRIDIQHIGPPATSDEMIRANIRVKPGDPYSRLAVDDDVRNLYATGQYLDIRVAESGTTNGVVITYVLQGKPRLTAIKFQGNEKYSDAKLTKKLTSKVGDALDEQKVFTDAQEIQKMYQKAGYPGTTVKGIPSIDELAGRGTVTFDIHEGHKIKITSIEFIGASAFTEKQLRRVIKTKEHGFFSWLTSSGVFKDEEFEDDQEILRQYYWDKGYIDFELKDVIRTNPTPTTMNIRFFIYEGRQYKVGSIKIDGNKLFTMADIAQGLRDQQAREETGVLVKKTKLGPNGFKMDVGSIYTPKGFTDDYRQLVDFYGARGYIDVERSLGAQRVPNTESGTMDVEFKLEEGQKSTIEKIEIRGNTKTKDRVIRRELTVAPGEVFNMVQVDNSKKRIEGLAYFNKVEAHPEPTVVPRSKNLVISVEEANTGNMMVGAGFSSVDSFVAFAEITQGNFDLFHPPNFTGGGQKFRLRLALGNQHQDYVMSFVEPWFLGRHLQLGVDIYHEVLNFQSPENLYDETRTGGRVGLTRALLGMESFIGTVGYRLENVGITFNGQVTRTNSPVVGPPLPGQPTSVPNTMLAEAGNTLISKIDLGLVYDTRGYGYLPNSGQKTELIAELAGPFGGERDYYKLELRTHWFFKGFAPGHVIEVLGGIGVADSYGNTTGVPFYDRYYLGGLNTLRGFKYRNVAPREAGSNSKEPIGGDSYWISSIEYSLPIIDRLRVAAFYDIGQVQLDAYSFGASGYSSDFGFGLRINLPIGGPNGMPLRLDYGIPIKHDQFNSGSGKFQFSGGFERPF